MPISNGWKYFPNNKGLVSGLVLAGFGFGAFMFNFVSTALVNPEDEHMAKEIDSPIKVFPDEVARRVPEMIRTLSMYWTILAVIGTLLLFPYKEEVGVHVEEVADKSTVRDESDLEETVATHKLLQNDQSPNSLMAG